MTSLEPSALAAAQAVATAHGLRATEPRVLSSRSNLLVHLSPAPVVARVATSTAALRPDVAAHFERELAVARFLAERGAPVVPPSDLLPPGPHRHEGLVLSFWRYVEGEPATALTPAELGRALGVLHEALREFRGVLPLLGPPVVEVAAGIDELEREAALTPAVLARLRDAHARVAPVLRAAGPVRALHGDAHLGNLMLTRAGPLWNDFEDTCTGPLEWDLACMVQRSGPAALAGYPDAPSEVALAPFIAARELQGVVWLQRLARRVPERAERAAQFLAAWLERG
jgi:Ser/Thr protein kinase RdoA (MazF antagonist)